MDHFDRFLEYARSEIGELEGDAVFSGPDSIEGIDLCLYAYGCYVIGRAGELDPGLKADSSNEIDHAEHKKHFLVFHSDYVIGGRTYRVVLEDDEFKYGKIADDVPDFERQTASLIRSVIRNYHHVLNHVKADRDKDAYNPGDSL